MTDTASETLTQDEQDRVTAYLDARDGLFVEYLDATERSRAAFYRWLVQTGRIERDDTWTTPFHSPG